MFLQVLVCGADESFELGRHNEFGLRPLATGTTLLDVPGRHYLETIIKPVLIGEDPLQIDRHWETLANGKEDMLYKLPAGVVGVIDVALWDLLGKEAGLPVYTLMGGAARKTIQLYWSTGSGWKMQPEEMLELVKKGWDSDFRAFKIRMDWKGWRQDANLSASSRDNSPSYCMIAARSSKSAGSGFSARIVPNGPHSPI